MRVADSSAGFIRQLQKGNSVGASLLLLVLCLFFTVFSENFTSAPNLINIVKQSTILLLLALPMTLIILTEGIDLSMGALLTLANVVLASLVIKFGVLWPAFFLVLIMCAFFGWANGLIISKLHIPPFVATLGTLGIAQGGALLVTDGQSVVGIPPEVLYFYSGEWMGMAMPFWIAIGACAVFHVLLSHTPWGNHVIALGGNREALTLAGIKADWVLVSVYVLSGVMCAIAAVLLTARISSGHPTAALGMEFDAIAAVALGGTSFEKGKGWLWGTVIGVLAVGVLRNGLNLMGVPSAVQVAAIGILVILALMVDGLRDKKND